MPDDDEILAGLDFELDDEPEVTDLSGLTNLELAELHGRTRGDLIHRGEMFLYDDPDLSEEGRELHALFTAIMVERRRRGW